MLALLSIKNCVRGGGASHFVWREGVFETTPTLLELELQTRQREGGKPQYVFLIFHILFLCLFFLFRRCFKIYLLLLV